MKGCSNCGKPALYRIGNVYLCVECNWKHEQAQQLEFQRNAAFLNFLGAQMDSISGLPGFSPQIRIPNPVIHQGPITFNNIDVDNSVVGSINTAQVKQIDVTMDNIRAGGNEEFANQLKSFTQTMLESNEISSELRDELVEGLSFISSQLALQKDLRRPSIVKSVLKRINEVVEAVRTLGPLWLPLLNQIKEYFQFAD